MSAEDRICEAWAYVHRTRNASKREYGRRYISARCRFVAEPERPADLSYLAAQAVRLSVDAILAGRVER